LKVIPYIDLDGCIGCEICVEICPKEVFMMSGIKAVVMSLKSVMAVICVLKTAQLML